MRFYTISLDGGERAMVKAIDVHIHAPRQDQGGQRTEREQAMDSYFRASERPRNPQDLAAKYKQLDIFGVVFTIDAETTSGEKYTGNDYIAEIVKQYPEQFMGFGSVDPWKGKAAVKEAERCARELGLRGLKFHPSSQNFFPN